MLQLRHTRYWISMKNVILLFVSTYMPRTEDMMSHEQLWILPLEMLSACIPCSVPVVTSCDFLLQSSIICRMYWESQRIMILHQQFPISWTACLEAVTLLVENWMQITHIPKLLKEYVYYSWLLLSSLPTNKLLYACSCLNFLSSFFHFTTLSVAKVSCQICMIKHTKWFVICDLASQ